MEDIKRYQKPKKLEAEIKTPKHLRPFNDSDALRMSAAIRNVVSFQRWKHKNGGGIFPNPQKLWGIYHRFSGNKKLPIYFSKSVVGGVPVPIDVLLSKIQIYFQLEHDPLPENFSFDQSKFPPIDTSFAFYGFLHGNGPLIKSCRETGRPFYYIDHAYIHRNRFFKITKNAFQAQMTERPDDRWKALDVELEAWTKNGRHILVIPPSGPTSKFWNIPNWLNETHAMLSRFTDRKIIIRTKKERGSLLEQFKNAHAVVAFHSNVATEAIIHGIPVFVDKISAASDIGLCDLRRIESPIYPDREPWLYNLAYSQFTQEEVLNGYAWNILNNCNDPMNHEAVERHRTKLEIHQRKKKKG